MAARARNGVHKPFPRSRLNNHGIAFLKEKAAMTPGHEQRITEMLVAAMTSGLPHKGATYQLPESLAVEFGRLCYNQAIKDVMGVFKMSDFGQTGLEMCDRIQDLHLLQRKSS